MDSGMAFRRLFHLAAPIFLGYYLIPETIGPNLTRLNLVILFLGTAMCIEVARIALGLRLFGMRPYETQRVSAYAQGALGLAFGLFVIQDPRIVVPVFLGMAWIDPFAALCRAKSWPRSFAVAAYAGLFLASSYPVQYFVGFYRLDVTILFTVVATTTAMLVEGPKGRQLDDDLLMQVVPMSALGVIAAALRSAHLL